MVVTALSRQFVTPRCLRRSLTGRGEREKGGEPVMWNLSLPVIDQGPIETAGVSKARSIK